MEKPDKRIMPLLILLLLGSAVWVVVWLATSSDSPTLRYVEWVLYPLTLVFGAAVVVLSNKLQYSVMRPSVVKAEDPQMFKMEVLVNGYACILFGLYLLYGLLT
ncbi:MAG: hypothetical protein QM709_03845 [Spongiibacteraceae bacterium]